MSPLFKGKSKKAPKDDMDMGTKKPDLAVAYNIQRQSGKKAKKMALGGAVEGANHTKAYSRDPGAPAPKPDNTRLPDSQTMSDKWSEGSAPAMKPGVSHALPSNMTHSEMAEFHEQEAAKYRMYAEGGMVEGAENDGYPGARGAGDEYMRPEGYMADHFAEGGMVGGSIAQNIMRKGKTGQADVQESAMESAPSLDEDDDMNDIKKELYDDSQLSKQPEDSNERGDDIDSDKNDMIEKIRSKKKWNKV